MFIPNVIVNKIIMLQIPNYNYLLELKYLINNTHDVYLNLIKDKNDYIGYFLLLGIEDIKSDLMRGYLTYEDIRLGIVPNYWENT